MPDKSVKETSNGDSPHCVFAALSANQNMCSAAPQRYESLSGALFSPRTPTTSVADKRAGLSVQDVTHTRWLRRFKMAAGFITKR